MAQIPSIVIEGWRIIFRVLKLWLRKLTKFCFEMRHKKDGKDMRPERSFKEVCCFKPPEIIRARPDPYVYSQDWLRMRNIAYVWDNPDFKLIDVATGSAEGRSDLKPNIDYDIEVTIHNSSFMAAIGTSVRFEVRKFGMGTSVVEDLGTVMVNVPGAGSTLARKRWRTPSTGGHNCLRVYIYHHDDANPLNNVGQHNTDIAMPASPTRKLAFLVGNEGEIGRKIKLVMDAYRLPKEVECAGKFKEGHQKSVKVSHLSNRSAFTVRQSKEYLRYLQSVHDASKFPVPDYLKVKLSHQQLEVPPGQEIEVTIEMAPPPKGSGIHNVNIHAFDGNLLIGGVTAYVREEGE